MQFPIHQPYQSNGKFWYQDWENLSYYTLNNISAINVKSNPSISASLQHFIKYYNKKVRKVYLTFDQHPLYPKDGQAYKFNHFKKIIKRLKIVQTLFVLELPEKLLKSLTSFNSIKKIQFGIEFYNHKALTQSKKLIKKCKQLETINYRYSIPDVHSLALRVCKKLRFIKFHFEQFLTSQEFFTKFLQRMLNLQTICITGADQDLIESLLKAAPKIKSLKQICIDSNHRYPRMADKIIPLLFENQILEYDLRLSEFEDFQSEQIKQLADNEIKNIQFLGITNHNGINELQFLNHFFKIYKELHKESKRKIFLDTSQENFPIRLNAPLLSPLFSTLLSFELHLAFSSGSKSIQHISILSECTNLKNFILNLQGASNHIPSNFSTLLNKGISNLQKLEYFQLIFYKFKFHENNQSLIQNLTFSQKLKNLGIFILIQGNIKVLDQITSTQVLEIATLIVQSAAINSPDFKIIELKLDYSIHSSNSEKFFRKISNSPSIDTLNIELLIDDLKFDKGMSNSQQIIFQNIQNLNLYSRSTKCINNFLYYKGYCWQNLQKLSVTVSYETMSKTIESESFLLQLKSIPNLTQIEFNVISEGGIMSIRRAELGIGTQILVKETFENLKKLKIMKVKIEYFGLNITMSR